MRTIAKRIKPEIIIALLAVLVVSFWFIVVRWPDDTFRIDFLDVGQGDAVLISSGGRRVLVDGGPGKVLLERLAEVIPFWERQIDVVFISHLHADHIGGLIPLLKRFEIGQIFINPSGHSSPLVDLLREEIKSNDTPVEAFIKGDYINIGNVTIHSLWPDTVEVLKWSQSDPNEYSMVLAVEYGEFSALLTSDVELSNDLHPLYGRLGEYDVLKVPHQGSAGSVSLELLKMVSPQMVVITVGENDYGHPDESILTLLRSVRVPFWRTDLHGSVSVFVKSLTDFDVVTKNH